MCVGWRLDCVYAIRESAISNLRKLTEVSPAAWLVPACIPVAAAAAAAVAAAAARATPTDRTRRPCFPARTPFLTANGGPRSPPRRCSARSGRGRA